eukprot:gnl/Hemi2/18171_TR6009_c0_g1_i1.p2 gnl/Hemi2/18171_TR6009_c0_g1~~gnl/Hemi2/18171_TR6009_c0_g1_i1.p2  ORF type:complete len:147 (-),score=49.60 gnl/Hemi2/18171_TR6009_c0_g1_i1:102-542(-)
MSGVGGGKVSPDNRGSYRAWLGEKGDNWKKPSHMAWGALGGLFVVVFARKIQMVPVMRRPWEHVIGICVGAFLNRRYHKFGSELEVELSNMMASSAISADWRFRRVFRGDIVGGWLHNDEMLTERKDRWDGKLIQYDWLKKKLEQQ